MIVGQGILPGFTALFLGLDAVKDFMATESRRLFWNLLAMAVAAGIFNTILHILYMYNNTLIEY